MKKLLLPIAILLISCQKDECDQVAVITQQLNENLTYCGSAECQAEMYRRYNEKISNLDCD